MIRRIEDRRAAWALLAVLMAARLALGWSHFKALSGFPFVLSPSSELPRLLLYWQWASGEAWEHHAMWLPGGFWVYGACLLLWDDLLMAPAALNTLFSLGTMAVQYAL